MAEAYKCDVTACNVISEGSAPGDVILNALGVRKHMCDKHTEALVESYFPDEKEDGVAHLGTPADKAEA